jgi:hypothetical protein
VPAVTVTGDGPSAHVQTAAASADRAVSAPAADGAAGDAGSDPLVFGPADVLERVAAEGDLFAALR